MTSSVKGLAWAVVLVSSAACRAQDSSLTDAMKSAIEHSHRMQQTEQQFILGHPSERLFAGEYVRRLRMEAFECRIQLRERFHAGMGSDLGTFNVTLEPQVRCAREPSGYSECAAFRVVLDVDWRHPQVRPLSRLATQLDDSPIQRATPICESRPPSPEDRESIRRGIANGDIVRIH